MSKKVVILETLATVIDLEDNDIEAETIEDVIDAYYEEKIVLSSEDFTGRTFFSVEVPEDKDLTDVENNPLNKIYKIMEESNEEKFGW